MLGASDAASSDSGDSPRDGARLDERGRLRVERSIEDDPTCVADACCALVSRLLRRDISVVSARVTGVQGSSLAMVSLRDSLERATAYLGGSAVAGDPSNAIARAVSQAVGLDGGALVMGGRRWWSTGEVKAVLVVESHEDAFVEGEADDIERQRALVATVPEVGRLAVSTESCEHRVLRLADASMVVTCDPEARILDEIDRWCSDVEALSD